MDRPHRAVLAMFSLFVLVTSGLVLALPAAFIGNSAHANLAFALVGAAIVLGFAEVIAVVVCIVAKATWVRWSHLGIAYAVAFVLASVLYFIPEGNRLLEIWPYGVRAIALTSLPLSAAITGLVFAIRYW